MDLNSVLIEGIVLVDPEPIPGESIKCLLKVESRKTYNDGGTVTVSKYTFRVHVLRHLAEIVLEHAKAGRKVRIVGHLIQDGEAVLVRAEHIEFRPQYE